jgi:hypothetical protein
MRKFITYGMQDFLKQKEYTDQSNEFLRTNLITNDHIDLIASLKQDGNRLSYPRSEWNNLLISALDDPNDIDDIKMITDLLIFKIYDENNQL